MYSDEQHFNEWYRFEKSQGAWWSNLPKCPKKLCIRTTAKRRNGGGQTSAENRYAKDKSKWKDPKKPSEPERLLHPGTVWSLRSKTVGGKSNQCTYDSDGILIRTPTGSGTVDFKAPGFSSAHYDHDVAPVLLAAKIDGQNKTLTSGELQNTSTVSKYLEVRPLWAEDE